LAYRIYKFLHKRLSVKVFDSATAVVPPPQMYYFFWICPNREKTYLRVEDRRGRHTPLCNTLAPDTIKPRLSTLQYI
jgi:hypothetical protein